jgi:hypothetical protein
VITNEQATKEKLAVAMNLLHIIDYVVYNGHFILQYFHELEICFGVNVQAI